MSQDFAKQYDAELKERFKAALVDPPKKPLTLRDRLSENLVPTLWLAVMASHFALAPLIYLVICSLSGPIKPFYGMTVTPCIFICWGVLLWLTCTKSQKKTNT